METTYNDLYAALRRTLHTAGVEAAELEARLILAHAAGKTPAVLLAELQRPADAGTVSRLNALTARRLAGEPVAYLTESWAFYGLELHITPNVLIPRSDTETLVERALELTPKAVPTRILDLCTGSGCIGLALAGALPDSRVLLADLSPAALAVAKKNTVDLGLTARVKCVELDVLAAPPELGMFDLIVSNPPYIPADEIAALDISVRDYEPRMALDGGADGLDFYRAIADRWTDLLVPGGHLLLEVGETQAPQVTALLTAAGLSDVGTAKDCAGYDRVVLAKK